jgi:hypothetical protein
MSSPAQSAAKIGASQASDVSRRTSDRDTDVSRDTLKASEVDLSGLLALVNEACLKADIGPEKLAIDMEMTKGYISNVLRGEKNLTVPFLYLLPGHVKEHLATLYLESRGYVVAKPVSFEQGMQHLLSGLFSVMAHREPGIRTRQLKSELRPNAVVEKAG